MSFTKYLSIDKKNKNKSALIMLKDRNSEPLKSLAPAITRRVS